MTMNRHSTCCFSGYRPEKFDFPLDASSPEYIRLLSHINLNIYYSIEQQYSTFLCSMAQGFDVLCGEAVLHYKRHREFQHIKLVAVVPYVKHKQDHARRWGKRSATVAAQADEVIFLCEQYSKECFFTRSHFMAAHASKLICYYDGKPGGAAYTFAHCQNLDIEIINIAKKIRRYSNEG